MSEHVNADTARKMIADPYCPITTRCLAEDVLAARQERDEARATLDTLAALVGGADVVERVRALLPVECERPTTTYRIRIGRNAPISEWIACCSRLGDGASYAVALLECVGEGIMPEQLTESAEAVADLREHMGDLITVTEHPYTDECAF